MAGGRKGKFNARGEHCDGHWFASAAEAERYLQLKELEAAGRIDKLQLQVTYPLTVNGVLITRYRADFSYDVIDDRGGCIRSVVEDIKGMITPEFTIKRKLYDALYPVKLSVIELAGNAIHPTNPALSEKTGKPVRCRRGWMNLHWKGRLPT